MRTTPTFPTKTFKPAAMALAVATTLSACLGGGTSAPDFNAGGTGIGSNSRATTAGQQQRNQQQYLTPVSRTKCAKTEACSVPVGMTLRLQTGMPKSMPPPPESAYRRLYKPK